MTTRPRHDAAGERRRSRTGPLACMAAGVVLVAGAVVLPSASAGSPDVGTVPTGPRAQATTGGPTLPAAPARRSDERRPEVVPPAVRAPLPAPPAHVRIPTLDAPARVVTVGTTSDGELEVPADVSTVGWWSGGGRVGDDGTVVLAGHVDGDEGPGAFFRLRELEPGDLVTVTDRRGTPHEYVVQARRQVGKTALPPEVFAQDVGPRLVLITCGGGFDESRRSYSDNIVVYAVPAG
jgi:hypothetical protein